MMKSGVGASFWSDCRLVYDTSKKPLSSSVNR